MDEKEIHDWWIEYYRKEKSESWTKVLDDFVNELKQEKRDLNERNRKIESI